MTPDHELRDRLMREVAELEKQREMHARQEVILESQLATARATTAFTMGQINFARRVLGQMAFHQPPTPSEPS